MGLGPLGKINYQIRNIESYLNKHWKQLSSNLIKDQKDLSFEQRKCALSRVEEVVKRSIKTQGRVEIMMGVIYDPFLRDVTKTFHLFYENEEFQQKIINLVGEDIADSSTLLKIMD